MFSFYALWIQKQCLLEVPKEKKLFEAQKTSAQKATKNSIFTKGLVHGLCQKMEIFNL